MTPHTRPRADDEARSAATARPADHGQQSERIRAERAGGRRGCSDDGAALVEFALLAPLIFMLIFGMITGGMALSYKNSMSNAVREGSRLGATLESSGAWADLVKGRVLDLSGDLTEAQVCVRLEGSTPVRESLGSECNAAGLVPDTPPGDGCVVKVWARKGDVQLNVIVFQRDLTLDVEAIAKYERGEAC